MWNSFLKRLEESSLSRKAETQNSFRNLLSLTRITLLLPATVSNESPPQAEPSLLQRLLPYRASCKDSEIRPAAWERGVGDQRVSELPRRGQVQLRHQKEHSPACWLPVGFRVLQNISFMSCHPCWG